MSARWRGRRLVLRWWGQRLLQAILIAAVAAPASAQLAHTQGRLITSQSLLQEPDTGRAAQPPAETGLPSIASLVLDLRHDLRRLPSVETAVVLGSAGAVSLALRPHDSEITRSAFQRFGGNAVFDAGTIVGELSVQAAGALSVFAVGRLAQSPRVARLGADLVRAQILNTAATHGTKALVDRRRPDNGRSSFPSGHASATFATAAVVYRHLGWKAGAAAYGLAAYTGASRITENHHYLTDVVFGAAIGSVMGRTVSFGHGRSALTLSAAPVRGGFGIVLASTQ